MVGEDLGRVDVRGNVDVEGEQRDVQKQEEHAGHGRRVRVGPRKSAESDAFADQGHGVADPPDPQGVHASDVVDCEGVEDVAAQRQGGVAAGEQQLHCRTVAEGAVERRAIV